MIKVYVFIYLLFSSLLYGGPILDRQDSMQSLNKMMREADKVIKNGEYDSELTSIYDEIQKLMIEFPTLFPEDSFEGKTKASIDILDNREQFNQISSDAANFAALAKIASENNDINSLQQN
ncbi:MAG: cytochrome c, partial [Flavobacteriaceae bacterium]